MTYHDCVTLTVRDTHLIIKITKTLKSDYFSDTVDMI
ncbi:hypothetical protein GX50_08811 [[Emmonsia] crescens]|uniref:Uncharacterized protein n=1 Tax=[Emmonsia] crescens TaxID=73230 RepID=A0A2B7Z4V9_9EURO|nr:hypothetical protein GX50_08811 [Emmonsia crescens]